MKFSKVLKTGLAAMMATSLVACSSSSSSTATSTSSSSDDTASTVKKFVLGGSGPLTGNAAVYGLAVKNAAQLAVDEINAEGGDVQFELVFEDDEADGEKATSAFNTLMDAGMQISLATVTSGAGQTVAPLYNDENIFAITPSGSSTGLIYADADNETGAYGNIFQMCFTDPNQGTASADYLAAHTELGTKVAVIYRNDDNYSMGLYNNFIEEAAVLNLDVVYEGGFSNSETDYSVYVQQASAAGADIVFLPIYYQPASQILAEANKQGYTASFFGCDGMDGILSMEGFDTSLAEGLYMLTPFAADATDDLTVSFVTAYETAYGDTPNQFAADAYDAVYAIKQALENAGVTADDSTDDITAALIEQFTSMTFDGLTGSNVTWKETGEVSKDPKAIVIENGVYVSVED